jgi:chemotaxis protein MotB
VRVVNHSTAKKETAMRRFVLKGVAFGSLVAASMLAGGCEQDKLEALKHENEVLMQQNQEYRDQIAELERYNAELKSENEAKDRAIAAKNEEIAKLQAGAVASKTDDGWQSTTFGDKISVGTDVLFAPGKANLTAAGQRALSQIISALRGRYAGMPVRVYGYTDSDPIRKSKKYWKDNLDLSANRAMEITRYLIRMGVSRDDIETIAMGDTHYVADNRSRDGKSKNRRVEIFVIKAQGK